jgi:hypothetical protein
MHACSLGINWHNTLDLAQQPRALGSKRLAFINVNAVRAARGESHLLEWTRVRGANQGDLGSKECSIEVIAVAFLSSLAEPFLSFLDR